MRLIQYATVHSLEHQTKGPANNIYKQMRMTRKLLRFLRTLEYSSKVREEAFELKNKLRENKQKIKELFKNTAFQYFLTAHDFQK